MHKESRESHLSNSESLISNRFPDADRRRLLWDETEYADFTAEERSALNDALAERAHEAFASLGGKKGAHAIIDFIAKNGDMSKVHLDEKARMLRWSEGEGYGASDELVFNEDPDAYLTPSQKLQLFEIKDLLGPSHFTDMPEDAQRMYTLSVRARAAQLFYSGSTYNDADVYGRLPAEIVEQEAELYNYIFCEKVGITVEELSDFAKESDYALPDYNLLPIEVSFATRSQSAGTREAKKDAMLEYVRAAIESLD